MPHKFKFLIYHLSESERNLFEWNNKFQLQNKDFLSIEETIPKWLMIKVAQISSPLSEDFEKQHLEEWNEHQSIRDKTSSESQD